MILPFGLFFYFGDLYFYRKDFDEAIRYYDYAVKLNPDLDKAYLCRGLVYIMIRVYDKALKDFSRVIDLKPNFAGAYEMRGTAFLGLNESDKALEDYNRAIELDPDSAEAYYNRGLLYYWLNRYEKLIKDFTIALELNPNDITIMTILSENYILNKEYGNARKIAEKILKIVEDDNFKILSHFFIICALLLQKKIENAKQEIYKLMEHLKETGHWKIPFDFQRIAQSIVDSDIDVETRATLTSLIDLLENKINLNQFSTPYSNN